MINRLTSNECWCVLWELTDYWVIQCVSCKLKWLSGPGIWSIGNFINQMALLKTPFAHLNCQKWDVRVQGCNYKEVLIEATRPDSVSLTVGVSTSGAPLKQLTQSLLWAVGRSKERGNYGMSVSYVISLLLLEIYFFHHSVPLESEPTS